MATAGVSTDSTISAISNGALSGFAAGCKSAISGTAASASTAAAFGHPIRTSAKVISLQSGSCVRQTLPTRRQTTVSWTAKILDIGAFFIGAVDDALNR